MRQTQLKLISSCATCAGALVFYLISGLPHPAPMVNDTETVLADPAGLGSGVFKHDLYLGDDRDTLVNLATQDLQLLAYYGG